MTEDEAVAMLNKCADDLKCGNKTVVDTGIGGPTPPGPKHREVLVMIVGLAETIKVLALETLKKQMHL